MKRKILLIAALAMIPILAPAKAEAGQRCKTYTKPIRIAGVLEIGYGKACKRGDVWEIVKLSGHHKARERIVERIYDDLDDYRVVIIDRDYHAPHIYDSRRVSYSKPYYYHHAYEHNYGQYKKAKKHHKKHYKHHKKHHRHSQCNGHH